MKINETEFLKKITKKSKKELKLTENGLIYI